MIIPIGAGALSAGVIPKLGGSLAYFRSGNINLMRQLSGDSQGIESVLGVAMFPMCPYADRIRRNEFSFSGRIFVVTPNNPPEVLNVHGSAWKSRWNLERAADDEALISLEMKSAHEPHSYLATQRLKITSDHLSVTMRVTNRGDYAMPFGFGQHPWFERERDVAIEFSASHFWLEGSDHTPTDRLNTPPELDFSRPRKLPSTWRNNDYSGWQGSARIRFPSRRIGLLIEASPIFRHLVLYADPEEPTFCLEPQTNLIGAFDRIKESDAADLGILILEPGESAGGTVTFSPFPL